MFGAHVLNNRVRGQVLVTLKSGEGFEGILWDADKQAMVLRNASQVGVANTPSQVVDGEVVVLLADVAYVQVVG